MRSTRASAALDRLKRRTGNTHYALAIGGEGLFCLMETTAAGASTRLCEPMTLDEFVAFVNAYGPQKPKRVSALDVAFQKQLVKKNR